MFTRSKHIALRAIVLLAAILSTAALGIALPMSGQISTVTDPVGDTFFQNAPAFQDIVFGQMAKTANGDFELHMELAGPVPAAPLLPPQGHSEIWWYWFFDLDPTTSPRGYPVPPGFATPAEFIVYVSWDGTQFADVPRDAEAVDTGRDCANGECVVGAIRKYRDIAADKSAPCEQRIEALKFLIHFVGDVHQPLHVSYAEDRGGNRLSLKFMGNRTNFHALWDTGMIEQKLAGGDWMVWGDELQATITGETATLYGSSTDPLAWANETLQITRRLYTELDSDDLGAAYYEKNLRVVEDQLERAGVRLATMLNAIFAQPTMQPVAAPTAVPAREVDLRPHLTALGLTPRSQGARGTCSIFTTCEAIEFAIARRAGKERAQRLSPEYLNWAAGQANANGHLSDGNFFHNALAGFEKHGICSEKSMPYQLTFDASRAPSPEAADEAARIREESRGVIVIHWIVPWQHAHFGVDNEQFSEIKRVLALGYPVAAGSGHSRLLVGYRDDDDSPGGGMFITEDSALNRFDEVTYEFVRKQVADVFWVEAVDSPATAPR